MGRIPLVLLACGSFNPITNQHMRLFELARDHMHYTGGFQVVGGIVSPVSDNYGKRGLVPAHHRVAMAKLALHSSDWVTVDDWESRQPDWTETVVTLRHHLQKLLGQRASVTDLQTVHSSHLDGGRIPPGRGLWLSHTKFDSFTCKPTGINGISREREVAKSQERSRVGQARIPTMIVFVCPPGSLEPPQLKLLCGADFLDTFRVPGLWREEHLEELVGHFGLVCVSRGDLQADRAVHESDTLFRHRHNIFLVREWVRNETSATEIRRALRRGLSVKYLLPDTVIEYIQKHELYTWQSEQRNKGAMLRPLRQQGAPSEQLNDSRLFEPET